MCSGSKSKVCHIDLEMEDQFQEQKGGLHSRSCSKLLELAATDDLAGFISEVEENGCSVDEMSCWYGRKIGSRTMGFEERTPIMIASLYGSIKVVEYILGTGKVDVNWACGSDGATALHCTVVGGSDSSVEVVKRLIEGYANIDSVDANGKKPSDLIPPSVKSASNSKRKELEILLKGVDAEAMKEAEEGKACLQLPKEGAEKKEYPIDVSLPDINTGIYGTDEFRMYNFKVKPCSRAYSHDWTECPFVHPGENARRRDPRKYHYSCVPCPEFKKGTCAKGDACEYAHGIFESWLHPAQYRTRLCKDEIGCSRKVCFFAHKPEELRPLYASTGSAMPSPKSISASMDMGTLSPRTLNSPSFVMPATSTPPMSPVAACSSPMSMGTWQNKMNLTPPALQLPGSRLKTASNVRDLELEMELLGLESIRTQQQQRQKYFDEIASLSSPSRWNNDYNRIGDVKPTNLEEAFGSLDPSLMSQLQGLSPRVTTTNMGQVQSPNGRQIRQNMNHLRASYPSNVSSSPVRNPPTFGFDSSAAVAAAVMNSRSASFSKRSQSFVDRSAVSPYPALSAGLNSPTLRPSNLSDWSSPDGKLNWGFNGEEQHRLQKSASFGFRNGNAAATKTVMAPSSVDEPDVSWVHSLVKDVPPSGARLSNPDQKKGGIQDNIPAWFDQLYIEQEQIMA